MKTVRTHGVTKSHAALGMLLCGLLTLALASGSWAESAPRPGSGDAGRPEYARHFDRARDLEKRGDWAGALRALARTYEAEVPVQAFCDTLERRKAAILTSLSQDAKYRAGGREHEFSDLRGVFEQVLLPRPQTLWADPPVSGELPLARFIYLMAVMGQGPEEAKGNPLLQPAAPWVDLGQALSRMDPWLVSAALFLARKGYGGLQPRSVIQRWQGRPDLWDEVCTSQALLFLAGCPRDEVEGLGSDNQDIQRELTLLRQSQVSGPPQAQVYFFWQGALKLFNSDYLQIGACGGLKIKDLSDRDGAPRPAGGDCAKGRLTLKPGPYYLSHVASRAQGKSGPFQCESGKLIRVVVTVYGNI